MAVVYTHPQRNDIGWRVSASHERDRPLPSSVTNLVRFDENTNATLLADLDRNYRAYTLVSGQLRKNNALVTINPPGQAYRDRQALPAILVKLRANDPLLPGEQNIVFRFLLRALQEAVDS